MTFYQINFKYNNQQKHKLIKKMVRIKINKHGRAKDYKKILNKNDPFDKIIFNMIKNNELSVSIVDINQSNYDTI